MDNFKVVAVMDSPVIANGRLTLDSILAAAVFMKTQDLELAHQHLPLDRTGDIWHGSAAFFSLAESKQSGFAASLKMSELESGLWQPRKGKYPMFVDQQRGPYLPPMDSYTAIESNNVWWYGRGNIVEVQALLDSLVFIGKKGNQGFGWVSEFTITEMDQDYSLVSKEGEPNRPIPFDVWTNLSSKPASVVAIESFYPPYFESPRASCVVPSKRMARF